MVAKRAQNVAPNNVAICYVYMLRSFGWGFTVTVVRDRKIRTARRTNQIVGFVTVPLGKKIDLFVEQNCELNSIESFNT